MKKLYLIFSLVIAISGCEKTKEVKVETVRPPSAVVKDIELERWKASIQKEVYSIDINKTPNLFITPKTYKLLAQKEETIPVELVGIIDKKGKRMALLQDPARKGYIVKPGDKLGKSLIKEIGPDYLIIEDTIENNRGFKTKKTTKIILKKERL